MTMFPDDEQNEGGQVAYGVSRWCILRTNGRCTLKLASSLRAVGIAAWTPSRIVNQRVPRSRATKKRTMPIMPTFVFADADHLDRLRALEMQPSQRLAIFRHLGSVPLISDRALDALRATERKVMPRHQQRTWREGQSVRVPEGAFAGMSGQVEQSDGKYTLVCFGGLMRVKIETFLLIENEADKAKPSGGAAARAA
jgi:hypothetical protein